MKKKTIRVITGERGLGMSYSTLEVELGDRDWYKKMNEALAREMERLRKQTKDFIRNGA